MNTIHVPEAFAVRDRSLLLAFVQQHDFVMLLTTAGDAIQCTHLPVLVDARAGVLRGHLARANAQTQSLADGRATVIARGPHGYISPRWYHSDGQVPTWNYAVVHVSGRCRLLPRAQRRAVIDALTARYEHGQWSTAALADRPREAMIDAIEAFEIDIERVEGKFKLGQNRSQADREGAAAALAGGSDTDRALGELMRHPPD